MILISEFMNSEVIITSTFRPFLPGGQAARISFRKTSSKCNFCETLCSFVKSIRQTYEPLCYNKFHFGKWNVWKLYQINCLELLLLDNLLSACITKCDYSLVIDQSSCLMFMKKRRTINYVAPYVMVRECSDVV